MVYCIVNWVNFRFLQFTSLYSLCGDLGKLLPQLSSVNNFKSLGNMSDELYIDFIGIKSFSSGGLSPPDPLVVVVCSAQLSPGTPFNKSWLRTYYRNEF